MNRRTAARRALHYAVAVVLASSLAACTTNTSTHQSDTTDYREVPMAQPRPVQIFDTTISATIRGTGPAVLLIHGAGEDDAMLTGQAEALVNKGFQAISYDRRGTGRSGRNNWPGNGAAQHADDAAALLDALDLDRATVLGLSSGGVIALELAARHPEKVQRAVAWEPPVLGVLPDGAAIGEAIMAPATEHLKDHPADFVGAQAILLTAILGFPVTVDDPAFAAARANAEPMVIDDPQITAQPFGPADLSGRPVTIAVGDAPLDLITVAAEQVSAWTGEPVRRLAGDHEIYLSDPTVLAELVGSLDDATA